MSESLKIAVDLLKDSAQQIHSWTTRLIAVNAGMFTGVGFIVDWRGFENHKPAVIVALAVICAFGAITSYSLAGIAARQITWNFHFRQRIRELQTEVVLPDEPRLSSGVTTSGFMNTMQVLLPVSWFVLFFFLWGAAVVKFC